MPKNINTSSTKKSMWCVDKKFEETSLEFLRSKSKILKELGTKEIVKDRDRQIKGIDLICDIPKSFPKSLFKLKDKNVDVKSIAKLIPTFSFEISGNVSSKQKGWLVNPNLATDYYLIVYHDIEDSTESYKINKQKMTVDNINYTKAILIKKEKLLKQIRKEFHEKTFETIIEEIRNASECKRGIQRFVLDNDGKPRTKERGEINEMWFTVSKQLKEEPVNIIIRRQLLEEIAERVWEVDGNGNPYIS